MARLSQEQIDALLSELPNWRVRDGQLTKTFVVRSFAHGVLLIGAIAQLAEAANHHPDVCLQNYNQVVVNLVTHSEGGLTGQDFGLARAIENVPQKAPK